MSVDLKALDYYRFKCYYTVLINSVWVLEKLPKMFEIKYVYDTILYSDELFISSFLNFDTFWYILIKNQIRKKQVIATFGLNLRFKQMSLFSLRKEKYSESK